MSVAWQCGAHLHSSQDVGGWSLGFFLQLTLLFSNISLISRKKTDRKEIQNLKSQVHVYAFIILDERLLAHPEMLK